MSDAHCRRICVFFSAVDSHVPSGLSGMLPCHLWSLGPKNGDCPCVNYFSYCEICVALLRQVSGSFFLSSLLSLYKTKKFRSSLIL